MVTRILFISHCGIYTFVSRHTLYDFCNLHIYHLEMVHCMFCWKQLQTVYFMPHVKPLNY